MRVAVIGGGPSGIMAAYVLASNGVEVDLYEAGPHLGGLAQTISVLGENVELGAHFLRSSYLKMLEKSLGLDIICRHQKRESSILFCGKMFRYPPSPRDLVKNLPLTKLIPYGLSFLQKKFQHKKPVSNSKEYLTSRLGNRFYSDFFEPYLKKIWGHTGDELSEMFASVLVGNTSFNLKSIYNLLKRKEIGDSYLDIVYPEGGFSSLWNTIGTLIEKNGGRVLTSMPISRLSTAGNEFILEASSSRRYDYIISTVPPLALQRMLRDEPGQVMDHLTYRNLLVVYINAELIKPFNHHCVYLYDDQSKAARITNLSHFKESSSHPILSLEYWLGEDGLWKDDDQKILEVVLDDLNQVSLLDGYKIKGWEVKRFKNAFVVPDLSMPVKIENTNRFFNQYENLYITGRNQSKNFNYSMEDAIQDGRKAARNVLSKISAKNLVI